MNTLFHVDNYFSLKNYLHRDLWLDPSCVWSYLKNIYAYCDSYSYRILSDISPQAFIENPSQIAIGEGTIIEPGAFIRGPCIIGKHCIVRHGAYIRGHVVIGDHCVIGHATEVKHSVFLDHAVAAHFAYIGDSVLGNHVNLGAGVRLANFRLDRGDIFLNVENERIGTGLKKMGAVIGDASQLGCNVVLNPGTLLQKNVVSYPNLNFGGLLQIGSIVKPGSVCSIEKRKMGTERA